MRQHGQAEQRKAGGGSVGRGLGSGPGRLWVASCGAPERVSLMLLAEGLRHRLFGAMRELVQGVGHILRR